MGWNDKLVDEVRRTKELEESVDRAGALRLLPYLPGAEVHYAYELLQNADDEGATQVEFRFTDEGLIVSNNGEPFDANDVWSVCSLGLSRKRRKIGFFGVGFKSVFEVTEAPQVISGPFNFEIKDFIFPHPREDLPSGVRHTPERGSSLVLRYGKKAKEDLSKSLSGLDARLLLFLRNVKEVRVAEGANASIVWHVKRSEIADGAIMLEDSRDGKAETWRVFKRTLRPPARVQPREKVAETEIVVALAPGRWNETRREPIYCYLPTRKQASVPFLLQADFTPTLGRENLKEDEWNAWLFSSLGGLAAQAVASLKDAPEMETSLFEYIPLEEEVTDPQVVIVLRAMYKALERLPFVRGARSEWLRPSEACLSPSELQSLFSPTEFSGRRSKRLRYAAPGLASRSWRVLRALGASQFDTEEMVGILQTSRILSSKSLPDLLRTYAFLARRLASDGPTEKALVTRLGSSAFLRTYEGRWESPEQAMRAGRIIAYPAKLTKAELARLPGRDLLIVLDPFLELSSVRRRKVDDKLERQRAQVKEFFEKNFGIRRSLTVSQVVFDLVIPKLSNPETPERVADHLLAFVRAHLARFVKEAQKGDRAKTEGRILAELGKRLPVAAQSADGGTDRRPLVSLYLRAETTKERMEDLFAGVGDVWFISGKYLRRRVSKGDPAWPIFFRKLGAWSSPRIEVRSGPIPMGNGEYAWIERGYSPKNIHQLSFDVASPDLEALFGLVPHDSAVSRFVRLWDALAANWTNRYQDSVFCEYGHYYYGTRYRSTVPTTFLHLLRSQSWVLGSDGTLHVPVDLVEDTPENRAVIAEGAVYAAWTGPKTMLEALGIRRSPPIEAVLARLKLLKEGQDPGINLLQVVLPAYKFLQAVSRVAPDKRADLAKEFEQWELLYMPRADKSWWPPSLCYLGDFESTFGPLRAYLDRYPREVLEFFEALGARSAPDFMGCLSAVDQLRALGQEGDATSRQTLPGIYKHMARLITLQTPEATTRSVALLAENGQWHPSTELYFSDDSRLRAVFPGLPYLYAPVTLQTIAPLLDFLGVHVLSSRVRVEKRIVGNRPIPSDAIERIRWACMAVMRELHRRVSPGPLAVKWALISKTLEVESVSSLKVRYILRHKGIRQTRTDQPSHFYSSSENCLYVREDGTAFDIASAVELARMFEIFADDARSILSALLPQARTEQSLFEALDRLGVSPSVTPVAPPTIQYLPAQGRTETGPPPAAHQTAVAAADSAPSDSASAVLEPVLPLKDPGRLVVGGSIQRSPYQAKEGTAGEEKTIVRRTSTGVPKPVVVRHDTGPTVQAAERTGHEIVEMVERAAGRNPISVATERKIGYDYDSSGRKIEVKGHQADSPPSTITLTDYEKKAAEDEGDSYWVYVVTGLRQGTSTKVYMIQNPLKYLTAKLPSVVELENWKAAVIEEYDVREKEVDQTDTGASARQGQVG